MCDFKGAGQSSSNYGKRAIGPSVALFLLLSIFTTACLTETWAAQVNNMPLGAGNDIPSISAGVDQGVLLAKKEKIYVQIDQAKILRLPSETRTVIVGNPMVADISTLRDGTGILTAKSYGTTNLIVLGEKSEVLLETLIGVIAASENIVVVQRGFERETYSCSPICQPLVQVGDGASYFGSTQSQISSRNSLATQK